MMMVNVWTNEAEASESWDVELVDHSAMSRDQHVKPAECILKISGDDRGVILTTLRVNPGQMKEKWSSHGQCLKESGLMRKPPKGPHSAGGSKLAGSLVESQLSNLSRQAACATNHIHGVPGTRPTAGPEVDATDEGATTKAVDLEVTLVGVGQRDSVEATVLQNLHNQSRAGVALVPAVSKVDNLTSGEGLGLASSGGAAGSSSSHDRIGVVCPEE